MELARACVTRDPVSKASEAGTARGISIIRSTPINLSLPMRAHVSPARPKSSLGERDTLGLRGLPCLACVNFPRVPWKEVSEQDAKLGRNLTSGGSRLHAERRL